MAKNNKLNDTINILKDLVGLRVLGGDSNLIIVDYIVGILIEKNIEYHLVPNDDLTKSAIICRIGPAIDGGIILSGHTDVVPVEGQEWSTAPFKLTKKDNKLYARGSADMKGFIACCLASIDTFSKANLKKPIYFAFSFDEEIGCLSGDLTARAFKKKYIEIPEFAIIGEPSLMQPVNGQKGICVLETVVNGSAGHSSRIISEVSAVHICARLIIWLEKYMESFIDADTIDQRFNPPHSSIHIGMIQGGIAPNVIADKCSFFWDIRTIPGHNVYDIIRAFQKYSESVEKEIRIKFANFNIITKEHHPPVPPLGTDNESSIVKLIQKISGNESLTTVAYAAEAGQFSNAGFKTVICGPGDIAQAHRADEFIEIDQIEKCLTMLEKLANEFSV